MVIASSCGSETVKDIEIVSFSLTESDVRPSIIGLPSFSTSSIVITRSSVTVSTPSEASIVIS